MRTLIVGAGATGGYLATLMAAAARDVTVLVRHAITTTGVPTLTRSQLNSTFDVVVFAVRGQATAAAVVDAGPAVGEQTRVFSVANGMDHLDCLVTTFGEHRTVGATARMVTSLRADGVIDVVSPGVSLQLGTLDGSPVETLAAEFRVEGVEVDVVADITAAMHHKFGFITATAALTCLARGVIGDVVSVPGGHTLADRILQEVGPVPGLSALLHDSTSRFGPSMYRDLTAGRRVEVEVLEEFARRSRRQGTDTPLLDAAVVALEVHNRRIQGTVIEDCQPGSADSSAG